jgi:hypothetical protein
MTIHDEKLQFTPLDTPEHCCADAIQDTVEVDEDAGSVKVTETGAFATTKGETTTVMGKDGALTGLEEDVQLHTS